MSPFAVSQSFALALQHHQAGRLKDAERLYRQILAAKPRHAEAHHRLGILAHQVGRNDLAVEWIRQALVFEPNNFGAHSNLGEILRTLGRVEEAIASLNRAIALRPDLPEAHNNLGVALRNQGRLEEAIAAYRRAIQLKPHFAEAQNNLGNALADQSHLEEAIAAYCQAIQLRPDYAEAHSNLGNALRDQGHLEEAVAAFRRAIQLRPVFAEAHNNLGATLRDQGRLEEALGSICKAIEFKPVFAEAHNNLGNALRDQGHIEEAIAAYRRAIQLTPDFAEAHTNLGVALRDRGSFDEALAAHHRALQHKPNCAGATWNTSLLLLLLGDFERGWRLFESRWETDHLKHAKRNLSQPMWQGEALEGRGVLLQAEQGFGDTLQFVRYAPLVAARGGRVIIECRTELKTLLTSLDGVSEVLAEGEPLPAFDLHCPLMSLPLVFGTRLETIPASIPYLRADALKVACWRERLDQENGLAGAGNSSPSGPLKIGLVWASGERLPEPRSRQLFARKSLLLNQFAPLAVVPGVVFVSLQKGGPSAQAKTPPAGMNLLDWAGELEDFADTAALVECLDLVISVDTAVAHLTGALGKPVWLLNRFDTCWRWFTEREDSPWYPTMRLFRQPRYMDWEPVIASVREQLGLFAAMQHSSPQDL